MAARKRNARHAHEAARAEALEILRNEAKASPDASLTTSSIRLGARIGRAPQTVAGWIVIWEKAGLIIVDKLPGNRGIRISFPDESRAPASPVTDSGETQAASPEVPSGTNSEASDEIPQETISETTEEAKPIRKRRSPRRRAARPELDISTGADFRLAQTHSIVSATTVPAIPSKAAVESSESIPESIYSRSSPVPASRPTLLGWTLRVFTLAAIALSVVMVGKHVASTEDSDPFAYWTLFSASILVSLFKPVLGTVAERLWAQRAYAGAILSAIVAFGALSYDATNLWAFRGEGLDDKAATAQASIDARDRNQAKLDDLIAEQKRLKADPPRPLGEIVAAIERTEHEPRCRPQRIRKGSAETKQSDACLRSLADLNAEKARAERVEQLAAEIDSATVKLEARPVQASAEGGAKAAAAILNWVSLGTAGVEVASPQGVAQGWTLAFVLLIEIVAVAGFGLAASIERSTAADSRSGYVKGGR